jgi:hypothetical protein
MKDIQETIQIDPDQQVLPFDPPLEERPVSDDDVPEIEALRAENEDLKFSLKLNEARAEIADALKAAGARSPGLLFSAAKDSLEFDDNGGVTNTEAIVGELKQRFPEQFTQASLPSIDGGAGTQNGNSGLSKEALSRMSPDEIAQLDWTLVKQALAS